jgi:hypothetical protein
MSTLAALYVCSQAFHFSAYYAKQVLEHIKTQLVGIWLSVLDRMSEWYLGKQT